MLTRRPWTDQEHAFLITTHTTLRAVDQARQLGRDYDTVCWKRQTLIAAGHIAPHTRAYAPVFTDADRERIVELAQQGYSVARISRALKRTYASTIHEIARLGGIRALRREETSRVRTPAEIGVLFTRTKHTVDKWVRLGWIDSTRNGRSVRSLRPCRLITDEGIQCFLAKRAYWPAWHPADITDPDWQAYAQEVREEAGGDWVPLKTVAHQTGIRHTHLCAWWRAGKLTRFTTLSYGTGARGHEYFIWSADVPAVATAMREDRRTGLRWSADGRTGKRVRV